MLNEKIKVLYVDDEEINLEIFKLNFAKKYDVFTAPHAIKGLEILKSNPDILVVVSDMRMPRMNGIEFIIEAQNNYPNIQYYILTGFELTPEIENAIEIGLVKAYFKKPFNIKEIDNEIKQVLNETK